MKKEQDLLFIGATHGDEGFSVEVLRKLEQKYPKDQFGYDWIVGNPEASKKGVRFTEADLNRVAPGNPKSSIYEERRAAEIMDEAKKSGFVIDIHGTVADCGIVTIIPYPTLSNLVLASLLDIQRNVLWYSKVSLQKGPLVQFMDCPGIEIECGPKSSEVVQLDLELVLSKFLERQNNSSLVDYIQRLKDKEFYSVYDPLPENGEIYTDFTLSQNDEEEFYPFLSNQYPGLACYKMKRIVFEDLFLT